MIREWIILRVGKYHSIFYGRKFFGSISIIAHTQLDGRLRSRSFRLFSKQDVNCLEGLKERGASPSLLGGVFVSRGHTPTRACAPKGIVGWVRRLHANARSPKKGRRSLNWFRETELGKRYKRATMLFLVVLLGAGLGGEGEGDIVAVGLAQDNLGLVDGGGGDIDGSLKGLGHQWDLERLGLVLLVAVLVLAATVSLVAVAGGLAGGHLHGLGLGLIGHLGSLGSKGLLDRVVLVCADLPGLDLGGLLADSADLLIAVVVVDDLLDVKGDWGDLGGEGWHAHLGVDGGVGVTAVHLGGVAVPSVGLGGDQGRCQEGQQILHASLCGF